MITKNDCMSILVKLGDEGINTDKEIKKLLLSKEIPLEIIKFIADNRGIEVMNFYEMLRKSHNKKKSPLYTNIVREQEDIQEVVITLSSLLTQIALYGAKLEDPTEFYKTVRANEITEILNKYYTEQEYSLPIKLLKVIKSDLVVLEYISGRREV